MFDKFQPLPARRLSFKFLLSTSITIALVFGLLFVWLAKSNESHIMDQVKKQAKILHTQLVLTRQWVADHKAVLIEKSAGVRSSPFLSAPDVASKDGTVYTKLSPSVVTKILSERAKQAKLYSFRLASAKPLNPDNKADAFEVKALERFQAKKSDGMFTTETSNGKTYLRYAAPVMVNDNCMDCHMVQGYKRGDLGGCLSVFVPMDDARKAISQSNAFLLGGVLAVAGSLVLLLFVSARSMVFNRISGIRETVNRMTILPAMSQEGATGDELKEIADFCYQMDHRLKKEHEELGRKIEDATQDLFEANEELGRVNKDLQRLNQAKSDFFSDISHELRSPLTSIKGAVDILARKASCEDPVYLDIIKRNTDQLIKTVVDFLDYSKLEAGQLELAKERGSLKALAEEAILFRLSDAEAKSVKLKLDAPQDIELPFDKMRLHQILTNLLTNAIRYSPENGEVRLRIEAIDKDWAQISIRDWGPGIDKRHHKAVFEKFYQAPDESLEKIHKGSSGIGLAICKGLVEAHSGRIWVESEPGSGSLFIFTLPIEG